MDFCVSFLHQDASDIPVIPAHSYLFHSTWSTRNLPFSWRKACAYPLPVWIPWCLELPLLTCQLWPACQRWYTAWFLTCFFTASCAAGRPMLEPEHGSLASMGKNLPQKTTAPKKKHLCHDSMTPWPRPVEITDFFADSASQLCFEKPCTRCGRISPPHSPTKKTHCEVSTSEPAQEVSLHLTGDNSWNCLSLLLLCHGCGWTSWSAGYPNVFGSRKDLMSIVHKMSPSLCTQKGTLQKHRIRMMFVSVQLTSSKSLRELVGTV